MIENTIRSAKPKLAQAGVARRPDGLVSDQQIKQFSQKSNLIATTYFIAHFAAIVIGGWVTWLTWSQFSAVVWIPVLLLHSVVLGFLFSPLHECAHSTAFRSRWLNETALWITAVVYIVPPYYFRYFHLGHHRFTQIPGKDPSLVLPEPANLKQYFWYCAGLWFWWRNITWITKHAAGRMHAASALYVPKGKCNLLVLESRILMLIYLLIAVVALTTNLGAPLLICWLIPRLLGEPVQRIIRVAEHVGCSENSDLLTNTRTTLTNSLTNLIAWQMPYHAEHHLFPNIPFYHLPKIHRVVRSKLVKEPDGYIAGQRKIIAMLRLSSGKISDSANTTHPLL